MDLRKKRKYIVTKAFYKGEMLAFDREEVHDFNAALNQLKGVGPYSEDLIEEVKKKGFGIRGFSKEDGGKFRIEVRLEEIPIGPKRN